MKKPEMRFECGYCREGKGKNGRREYFWTCDWNMTTNIGYDVVTLEAICPLCAQWAFTQMPFQGFITAMFPVETIEEVVLKCFDGDNVVQSTKPVAYEYNVRPKVYPHGIDSAEGREIHIRDITRSGWELYIVDESCFYFRRVKDD